MENSTQLTSPPTPVVTAITLLVLAGVAHGGDVVQGGAAAPVYGHATDHLLVRFAPGAEARVEEGARCLGAEGLTPVLRVAPADANLASGLGLDRTYRLELGAGADPALVAAAVRAGGGAKVELVEFDGLGGPAGIPNDPAFPMQWPLLNSGTNGLPGGTPGADIHAVAAWSRWNGPVNLTVAIIDTGIDPNHPELVPVTIPGWNVLNNTTNVDEGDCPHGSLAAGLIGAVTNNWVGIASVCPGVRIMPVKVLSGCTGTESNCAAGIVWAADHGASVANISLQFYDGTSVLRGALDYAWARGMVVVAAAGNFATAGTVAYPAKFLHCIAVSATTNRDLLASYSNTGPEIAVAAPGDEVYAASYTGYSTRSGTSMASAHVAGVACFVRAMAPTLTPQQVRDVLTQSADDLAPPGFDPSFGWGRLNMDRAALLAPLKACYANCDGSVVSPVLNLQDFTCYMEKYAAGSLYANCDGSTTPPILTVADFTCYIQRFADGCGGH